MHRCRIKLSHGDRHFHANRGKLDAKGKTQFFGAVKVSGRRHSFHFMPVYDFPELLVDLNPALKKHMQGKSCFNFTSSDQAVLDELQSLIGQGVFLYKTTSKL